MLPQRVGNQRGPTAGNFFEKFRKFCKRFKKNRFWLGGAAPQTPRFFAAGAGKVSRKVFRTNIILVFRFHSRFAFSIVVFFVFVRFMFVEFCSRCPSFPPKKKTKTKRTKQKTSEMCIEYVNYYRYYLQQRTKYIEQ